MKSGCKSLPGTELHPTALVMRLLLSEYAGSTQVSKVLAEKYTQLIFSDTCCSKRFIIQNLFLQQQVNAACDCKHGTLFFPHAVQEGNQSTQLWSQFRCWHWNEYKNKPNNNKNIHVTCIKYQHEISTSEGTVTRSELSQYLSVLQLQTNQIPQQLTFQAALSITWQRVQTGSMYINYSWMTGILIWNRIRPRVLVQNQETRELINWHSNMSHNQNTDLNHLQSSHLACK